MALTVLFDIGGTLVDSPDFFETVSRRLCDNMPDEKVRDLAYTAFMKIYEKRESEHSFLKIEELLAEVLELLSRSYGYRNISDQSHDIVWEVYLDRSSLYPEVITVMKKLHENNVSMVVASDADTDLMESELRKFNIGTYFSGRCVSEIVKAYKPAPAFVDYLKRYTADNPDHCYFVGDSRVDIETAKRLEIKSVLVDRKRSGNRFKADFAIHNLEELLPILGLSADR